MTEKLSQKWTIVIFLEPVEEGFEFFWKDYPLHITLADVFAIKKNEKELVQVLLELVPDELASSAIAGDDLHWGKNGEITVVEILESVKIKKLHDKIYAKLISLGAVHNEPQFEGENFVLHCTVQKNMRLLAGEKVQISSVSLIDMFPNGNGYQRKIIKTVKLK